MNDKNAWWKFLILAGLVSFSMVLTVPPDKKIRRGLDIEGGISYIVKVDESRIRQKFKDENPEATQKEISAHVSKALKGAQQQAKEVIENRINRLGIAEPDIRTLGVDNRIEVQLPGVDASKREEAEKSLRDVAYLEFRIVHERDDELVAKLYELNMAPEGYTLTTIGDKMGYRPDPDFPAEKRDEEYMRKLGLFQAPSGYEFLLEKEEDRKTGRIYYSPCYVKKRPELTGDKLKTAGIDYAGAMNTPVVSLSFDAEGAKKFRAVTTKLAPPPGQNPTRRLAIVLDGALLSSPYIKVPIRDGNAIIEGNFTRDEVLFLSNMLREGALPTPVKIVEKREVSASLGQDAVDSGVTAAMYGGIGVLLFMLLYYRVSGAVANTALVLNMLILPVGMWATAGILGAVLGGGPSKDVLALPVLTLPGIAGIVLTIGMAVDANVLIFERIREELQSGKRVWAAVTAGFDRAYITILDSNLTTLLAGVILFFAGGSGPIRGFAVTLCGGILISMYTALTVTKLFFDIMVNKFGLKSIKMMKLISGTKIDFLGKRKVALIFSIIVIAGTLAFTVNKANEEPGSIFSVDFTGGVATTFSFDEKKSVEEIRTALDEAGVKAAHIQYQKELDGTGELLHVRVVGEKSTASELIENAITESFKDAGYTALPPEAALGDSSDSIAVEFAFDDKQELEAVKQALGDAGIKDANVEYRADADGSDETLVVSADRQTVEASGEESAPELVNKAIVVAFADAGYKMEKQDAVGARIGAELRTRALWAVGIALVGMILYITLRFELGFAAGAIAALAHDVLITVGIFAVCGRPFSLTFVAALLTIVGYSINDTIVIFDRIREDIKLERSRPFKEICNLSINQTLGRTILTTITTLITVVVLLVFGGGAINDFALALFIGIVAGTYSTIFIATPTVLAWYRGKKPVFHQPGA